MFVIAGVTGHVGGIVAEELLAKKQPIKVIVRDAAKGAPWSKRGAEVAVGTLDDQTFLAGALRGAKAFFTLLPPPPFSATDFYGAQCKTADAIARAVKASGVPYVVLLSSVGADLPSGTGPIRGLHYLEEQLRKTDVQLTAIRAGYFQENLGGSVGPARAQGIFPNFTPSSDYPMPMIATRDIGMVAAQSLLSRPAKSETVDLQGPAYSQRQLAEKLGAALGKQLNIVDIPEVGWIPALTGAGLPQHVAEVYAEMYRGFASGAIRPKGDRAIEGKTTIDEVVKKLTH